MSGKGGERGWAGGRTREKSAPNSRYLPPLGRALTAPRLPYTHSATLLWRKDFKPEAITWTEVSDLNTGRLELLDQRDNAGRPINFFRLR